MPPTVLAIGGTAFPFHDFEHVGPLVATALARDADVTLTTEKEDLTDLDEYDVVLDYLTDSTLTDEQLDSLLSFVENGGGYVGLHCASDLTSVEPDDPDEVLAGREEPFPKLRELVGGHFITHPEQSEYEVEITVPDHEITAGVSDFTVFDEPYQVAWDDDVRVLAEMNHPDLETYPVAWTKAYGNGRVFYLSIGHTDETFATPEFQTLLANGVRWAAGE
jgi:type 1 glutamine amidotransferase